MWLYSIYVITSDYISEDLGSNPNRATVLLVQMVRTSDCGSEGRGFKSHIAPMVCSSSGLGHRPFTAATGVQISYRSLMFIAVYGQNGNALIFGGIRIKMTYKILTKYTSVLNKDFYEIYNTIDGSGNSVVFETSDLDTLKAKVKELDKEIGYENIMIVSDLTYDILVSIGEEVDNGELSDDDIDSIYNVSYEEVYGGTRND